VRRAEAQEVELLDRPPLRLTASRARAAGWWLGHRQVPARSQEPDPTLGGHWRAAEAARDDEVERATEVVGSCEGLGSTAAHDHPVVEVEGGHRLLQKDTSPAAAVQEHGLGLGPRAGQDQPRDAGPRPQIQERARAHGALGVEHLAQAEAMLDVRSDRLRSEEPVLLCSFERSEQRPALA
jgi:hypothetical protein